jgi:hypothetical protein
VIPPTDHASLPSDPCYEAITLSPTPIPKTVDRASNRLYSYTEPLQSSQVNTMDPLSFVSPAKIFADAAKGAVARFLDARARRAAFSEAAAATYQWCESRRSAKPEVLGAVYRLLSSEACARQVAAIVSDAGHDRFDIEPLDAIYGAREIDQAPPCVEVLHVLTHELVAQLERVVPRDLPLMLRLTRLGDSINTAQVIAEMQSVERRLAENLAPRDLMPGFTSLDVILKRDTPSPEGPVFGRRPIPEWQDFDASAFSLRSGELNTVRKELQDHRVLWLAGGHASGKTILALALGYTLMTSDVRPFGHQRKATDFTVWFSDIRLLGLEQIRRLQMILPDVDNENTLFVIDSVEHERELATLLASFVVSRMDHSYWVFAGRRGLVQWGGPFGSMMRVSLQPTEETVQGLVTAFAAFGRISPPTADDVKSLFRYCGPDLLSTVVYLRAWQREPIGTTLTSFLGAPRHEAMRAALSDSPLLRIRDRYDHHILTTFLRLCALSYFDLPADVTLFPELEPLASTGEVEELTFHGNRYLKAGHPSFARHLLELAAYAGYLVLDRAHSITAYTLAELREYVAQCPSNLGSVIGIIRTQVGQPFARSLVSDARIFSAIKAFIPKANIIELAKILKGLELLDSPAEALGGVENTEQLLNVDSLAEELTSDASVYHYFVLAQIAKLFPELGRTLVKNLNLERLLAAGPALTIKNVQNFSGLIKRLAPERIDEFYEILEPTALRSSLKEQHPIQLFFLLHALVHHGHASKARQLLEMIDLPSLAEKCTSDNVYRPLYRKIKAVDRKESTSFAPHFRNAVEQRIKADLTFAQRISHTTHSPQLALDIELVPVVSTYVARVGYASESRQLHVEFLKGSYYIYDGVPEQEYQQLLHAPSIGRYLNEHVKKHYAYRSLR